MKTEIKKALINKYFICVCSFGIILSILHCYQVLTAYNSYIIELEKYNELSNLQYNPLAEITSAFTMWIGVDNTNKITKIFFFIFPLMAVMPYCWSYCSDMKSGYAEKSVKNIGKFNYHLSKYIAVFISSGLTIAIPLLLNFLIILLFVPAISPDSVYDIYYGIFSNNFMADIFYGQPFVYVLIFLLLCFVFCGLFGCLGYSISTLIKSKIIAIVVPIVLMILVEFVKNLIMKNDSIYNIEFSPLSFLCPAKSYTTNWIIIISEVIILFFITFSLSVLRFKKTGRRKDNDMSDEQGCAYEK